MASVDVTDARYAASPSCRSVLGLGPLIFPAPPVPPLPPRSGRGRRRSRRRLLVVGLPLVVGGLVRKWGAGPGQPPRVAKDGLCDLARDDNFQFDAHGRFSRLPAR